MMDIPYYEEMGDMGGIYYKPLNPTGRWKLESGPNWVNRMYIEHQGFIFKRWIPEDNISFRHTEVTKIFDCKSKYREVFKW